jgi:hypothetical protein
MKFETITVNRKLVAGELVRTSAANRFIELALR